MQVNNGVYKSGFATTQTAYDRAQRELYATLDMLERRLQDNDFLVGDRCQTIPLREAVRAANANTVFSMASIETWLAVQGNRGRCATLPNAHPF